jgi:hypothetical protein
VRVRHYDACDIFFFSPIQELHSREALDKSMRYIFIHGGPGLHIDERWRKAIAVIELPSLSLT